MKPSDNPFLFNALSDPCNGATASPPSDFLAKGKGGTAFYMNAGRYSSNEKHFHRW